MSFSMADASLQKSGQQMNIFINPQKNMYILK